MTIPKLNEYHYPVLTQETADNGIRHYITSNGNRVPSVTTIISEMEDKSYLDDWRNRIGDDKADEIVRISSVLGSHMHDSIERWLKDEPPITGNNLIRKQARFLAQKIIDEYLKPNLSAWHGSEVHMEYDGLYAGTSDLIGIYKNSVAIVDFKNSRKPKKLENIGGYLTQLAAYGLAHNFNYGTNIQSGYILMASREDSHFGVLQEFEITGSLWKQSEYDWCQMLEAYYERQN